MCVPTLKEEDEEDWYFVQCVASHVADCDDYGRVIKENNVMIYFCFKNFFTSDFGWYNFGMSDSRE